MGDVKEIEYTGKLFCGLISFNFGKPNFTQFNELAKSLFDEKGILIYEYNQLKDKPSIEMLTEIFQIDVEEKIRKGQIVFVCTEESFLDESILNIDDIINFYEKRIDDFKAKGFEKIVILTKRDTFYANKSTGEDIYILHKRLKNLCRQKDIMIVVKYIIDDFNEKDFLKIISLHDLFILEGANKGHVYTYLELIKTSLVSLSSRQKREEEYRQELKRVEYLKSLGELSESLAHDFNNLLTTIVGLSQVCLSREINDELKEYLDVIYKAAIDGKAMIDKIQDYIKGSYNAKKSLHRVNDLTRDSISMIKYKLRNDSNMIGNSIKLVEDLKSEGCIFCNEYELRQVLLNILLNSIDSMEKGGTLTIRTYDKGETAVIEIEDTGIGIKEDIIDKIFEPFFTTKGIKGTGLGLNTAQKIVEDHFGKIQVKSKIGTGSKFTIFLPVNVREAIYGLNQLKKFNHNCAENILVVDDKYSVAKSIQELFSLLKINADIEIREEKILERLSEKEYDVIICDYSMPNMDGVEVSKLVKEKYPKKPFILLTGSVNKKINTSNTVDYVLKKPCTVEELAQAVAKVLNNIDNKNDTNYNII